ncbi:hypothetical protein JTE90_012389 [Oedothorax gibbosus]|uniref:Reverse transcriptase n=1 Tax=Oedothorax gibbosus TaxID=931172 RepID=A0AAV6TXX6_9ARAC|nr:hypothetical protein JTE90_012389 [Oedothorax gibbosus]
MIESALDKAAVDSAVEYLTEKLIETSASKLRALRRRAVRAGSNAEKEKRHIVFKRERAQYRRALLVAKRESWRGYCQKVGPWTVPYLIGAGKFRSPQVIGAVKDQNGHLYKDMANTSNVITDAIFPRDDPQVDSAVHYAHRRLANTFVNPSADRDFTANEISGVVKSLAHRKTRVWMEFLLNLSGKSTAMNQSCYVCCITRDYLYQRQVSYLNGDEVICKDVERECPQGSYSGPLLGNLIADEALKLNGRMGATPRHTQMT